MSWGHNMGVNIGSGISIGTGITIGGDAPVTSGLTMWLDANNPASYSGSGSTWYDLSGNGANITLVGSPAYSAVSPAAFTFNGTSQYGTGSTANVLPNNQYTKSMWFQLSSYAFNNNIVSSFAGGHFTFASGGNIFYSGHQDWANYNAFPTTATFNLATWYYVAVTFQSGSFMRMYVNGVLDSFSTYNLSPHPGDGSVDIASYQNNNLLCGKMSEFYCYNRALTDAEVLQNFNATRGKYGV
mgnify:CR=1 FL=1